ncbi:MAG: hypothetical protein QOD93_382, partial [Acetobacteraceae bacterium]|nr:hypothetical protein [Acetobacteraceae bacterium]
EREIDRIGGRAPVRLNVRIIATTNKDLEQEVARQTFREDLYFRLNVVAIHLPGLRDRPNDIQALAEHFIEKYRWENGRTLRQLSAAALAALMAHDWPGNVRELENTIHRSLVLTTESVIGVKDLEIGPPSNYLPRLETEDDGPRPEGADHGLRPESADYASSFVGRPLHLVERDAIIGTLRLTGGNRTRTASMLGLSIRALRNKISLYSAQGINVPASGAARTASPGVAAARITGARTP